MDIHQNSSVLEFIGDTTRDKYVLHRGHECNNVTYEAVPLCRSIPYVKNMMWTFVDSPTNKSASWLIHNEYDKICYEIFNLDDDNKDLKIIYRIMCKTHTNLLLALTDDNGIKHWYLLYERSDITVVKSVLSNGAILMGTSSENVSTSFSMGDYSNACTLIDLSKLV